MALPLPLEPKGIVDIGEGVRQNISNLQERFIKPFLQPIKSYLQAMTQKGCDTEQLVALKNFTLVGKKMWRIILAYCSIST